MSTTDLSGFDDGARLTWNGRLASRRFARRLPRVTLMDVGLVCGVALVAALVVASMLAPLAPPSRPPAAVTPTPALPVWIDIARPLQLYDLSGSPFAKLPLAYGARRRTVGIERQDTLSFGAFDGETPYLTLAITRRPDEAARPEADLVVELARAAAVDGIAVMRASLPTTLPTRFGSVAVAEVGLQRGTLALPCLGFRLDAPAPSPVAMVGLACGTAAQRVERAALACAIERIDLVSAGEDTALRGFFVDAERRRGHVCDMGRSRQPGTID